VQPICGHLMGVPAEEVAAGLTPMAAVMLIWARGAGWRLRHRINERRDD
jgi:hypothetical protein